MRGNRGNNRGWRPSSGMKGTWGTLGACLGGNNTLVLLVGTFLPDIQYGIFSSWAK